MAQTLQRVFKTRSLLRGFYIKKKVMNEKEKNVESASKGADAKLDFFHYFYYIIHNNIYYIIYIFIYHFVF